MTHPANLILAGTLALLATPACAAPSFTTVYNFTGGADGAQPQVIAADGARLIVATEGSSPNWGTIDAIDPATGNATVLYTFATQANGWGVTSLAAHGGFIYGTTIEGPSPGNVFRLDPKTGKLVVLYSFSGGSDGAGPNSLTYLNNALYGAAGSGGTGGNGTLFRIDLAAGTESTVYRFAGGADGVSPNPMIVVGSVLYGSTGFGGTSGNGTLFRFDPSSATKTTLYSFAGGSGDGAFPSFVLQHGGLLYGATDSDGARQSGTLYEFNLASGHETVLYSYGGTSGGCGGFSAPLWYFSSIYLAGSNCGRAHMGAILGTHAASGHGFVAYNFTGGADGSEPGAMIPAGGAFYGIAGFHGALGHGTVFKFIP